MTQGSLQKAFTIENINSAISTYMENSENKKSTSCLLSHNKIFFKNNYLDKNKYNNKILLQNQQIININNIPFKNDYKTQINKIDEFHKNSNEFIYNKNETNSTRNVKPTKNISSINKEIEKKNFGITEQKYYFINYKKLDNSNKIKIFIDKYSNDKETNLNNNINSKLKNYYYKSSLNKEIDNLPKNNKFE